MRRISFFLLLLLTLSSASAEFYDVPTANGQVSGKALTIDGRQVWQFVGIPFAKPPVGNLRFLPPQPLEDKWSEPLIADRPPKGCLQPPSPLMAWPDHLQPSYGEDCLFLHVWTPSLDSTAKKTVMFWIHGGGFTAGEGLPLYNGSALSSIGDVVVVTIQYRLGFTGFARFDGSLVPGNNGLLDQQMALRWVHENIENFGGDSNSVTIFGESAGSGSVSLHLMNPESGRYFKRAIMQSGAAGCPWAVNDNPDEAQRTNRQMAAEHLKCEDEDASALLRCLQSKSSTEMTEAMNKMFGPGQGPVVDGFFVPRSASEMMTSGAILKKDVLLGVTNQEGSTFTVTMLLGAAAVAQYTDPDITKLADEAFVNITIDLMFSSYPGSLSPVAKEMIRLRSISHVNPKSGHLNAIRLSETLGEYTIYCGVNKFADAIQAVHDRVYFYELAHTLKQPFFPILSKVPEWMKCGHIDDVVFVFALPLVFPDSRTMTEDEMFLARRIIADFTTFAKTGSPQDPNWRPFTLEAKEFYRYGVQSTFEIGGVRRDECVFWDKILPMVNQQRADSKSKSSKPQHTGPRSPSDEL